MKHDESFITFF